MITHESKKSQENSEYSETYPIKSQKNLTHKMMPPKDRKYQLNKNAEKVLAIMQKHFQKKDEKPLKLEKVLNTKKNISMETQ